MLLLLDVIWVFYTINFYGYFMIFSVFEELRLVLAFIWYGNKYIRIF